MGRISSTVRRGAARVGIQVSRLQIGTDFSRARTRLLVEHNVEVVLDVGANEGAYGLGLREHGFEGRIVSFEPLPEAARVLAETAAHDAAWEVVPAGLGSTSQRAELKVSGRQTSSSFLPMKTLHLEAAPESEYVGQESVRVERLDDIRHELGLEGSKLCLKLDVQGYELKVLEGGRETVADVDVIEVELSFAQLYEGQPLFDECLQDLRSLGFVLVDLEPVLNHPITHELLQVNGLFHRPSGHA
jgi:FkbM family methyltransferase